MLSLPAFAGTLVLRDGAAASNPTILALIAGSFCLAWYTFVVLVCGIGYVQLWRHYSHPQAQSRSEGAEAPRVTVIRPVKGLEPSLYECLAATFHQSYPCDKLAIFFCISNRQDPALPVLETLVRDFPSFNARILVEDEDPHLQGHDLHSLGPNPKIRNMSRAYREAEGDLVWIIDCNVWVARGTLGRMVDSLEGRRGGVKNKFVHLLPLVIDTAGTPMSDDMQALLGHDSSAGQMRVTTNSTAGGASQGSHGSPLQPDSAWSYGGGRLEELFMSSSHAKFYTAINTVLIAPCIVGKSTMFRKSHLDALTDGKGIDFFSENICEDHLIGDLLWRNKVPEEQRGEKWGKHAMVFGDLAIQPMAAMSVRDYVARRIRWLRVRKYTVTLATLVEPGTESFLCSLYGAFAVTTLPIFAPHLPPTWTTFGAFWIISVCLWALVDWTLYLKLHSAASIALDEDTPDFARPPPQGRRRSLQAWLCAWLGREMLAWPIWAIACLGGATVVWRGGKFWVGTDMKVHEIKTEQTKGVAPPDQATEQAPSKARRD